MTTTLGMKASEDRSRFIERALIEQVRRQDVADLVRLALSLPREVEDVWSGVREALERDEFEDLDALGHALQQQFDAAIKAIQGVRSLVQREGLPEAELLRAVEAVQTRRDAVLNPWPWSHLPLPEPDRETIRRSREQIERGNWGEPIEDILARAEGRSSLSAPRENFLLIKVDYARLSWYRRAKMLDCNQHTLLDLTTPSHLDACRRNRFGK